MLISFEGIDGCGKSTQIKLLKSYFQNRELSYHIFREPGGTEISERVRSLLLHETDEMDPVTELLLFSAARSQLIREKVIPLLNENNIVLLDRFYDSTTAYQGYGRESASIEAINTLNEIASHSISPDITIYLKILPEEADKRTQSTKKDRMEISGLEFFKRVADGYDKIAANEKRVQVIDATQSPGKIHEEIVRFIEPYLV